METAIQSGRLRVFYKRIRPILSGFDRSPNPPNALNQKEKLDDAMRLAGRADQIRPNPLCFPP